MLGPSHLFVRWSKFATRLHFPEFLSTEMPGLGRQIPDTSQTRYGFPHLGPEGMKGSQASWAHNGVEWPTEEPRFHPQGGVIFRGVRRVVRRWEPGDTQQMDRQGSVQEY